MGRAPILHPPGSEVSARPSRASSGAQKRMEARICAAVSPGRVAEALVLELVETVEKVETHNGALEKMEKKEKVAEK